ncbi:MAG: hypothetical protein ACPGVG_15810 [Mycobacterium sp.]
MITLPMPMLSIQLEGDLAMVPREALMVGFHRGALLAAEYVKGLWIKAAQGMKIHNTGDYVRGIQSGSTSVSNVVMDGNTWSLVIMVVNTSPHASIVEEGHGAYHLPSVINWGSNKGRIKRTSTGKPYLHIPFRHAAHVPAGERIEGSSQTGTTLHALKRMMPEHIYKKAKQLTPRIGQNVGPVRSASGQFQAADKYRWHGDNPAPHRRNLNFRGSTPSIQLGSAKHGHGTGEHNIGFEAHRGARMVGRDPKGRPMVNPAWQANKFHGLFKAGPKGHSQYMTIRTVTPDSVGWNIPAQQGRFVARRVAAVAARGGRVERLINTGLSSVIGRDAA